MGFKKVNFFWLIKNGVMTGTSILTSIPQDLQNFDNTGLEVTWTGTPTGTINVLGSVSAAIPQAAATNYYSFTFNPALNQPVGSAGGYLIDLNNVPFPKIEVQYTNISGTGVLNVYLYSKDLN